MKRNKIIIAITLLTGILLTNLSFKNNTPDHFLARTTASISGKIVFWDCQPIANYELVGSMQVNIMDRGIKDVKGKIKRFIKKHPEKKFDAVMITYGKDVPANFIKFTE